MSEEFVRCPECGNLNIKGTKLCVFCDADVLEAEVVTHEVEAPPEIAEIPSAVDTSPGTQEEAEEEPVAPKMPDFDKIDTPAEKKKEITITDAVGKEYSLISKLLFISLFTIIVSIIHYSINFLIALASIDFDAAARSLDVITFLSNILDNMYIRGVSLLLCIPFAILVGYVLGKIVRKYTTSKKSTIIWVIFSYILNVILNVVFTVALIFITDAWNNSTVMFIWMAGAAFIFVVTLVITLFIPMISGSFLIFKNIDKVFFRGKYTD